ncbi:MAG TPA: DinB family protein [Anaerolineae bacterium]|nr:DinB family protein [Anaerolineae bacterium]
MFDFTPVIQKKAKLSELTAHLTIDDLRSYTNEMIDTMLSLIADCTDADVTFAPSDPQADDKYAATEGEVHLAWTLGHLIVHVTASAEESAFLAAELARGVTFHGRSRYEVPWQTVTSIAQCRDRLEESRRVRLASLDLWPNLPHLDNTYEVTGWASGPINCVTRFMFGLSHDNAHLDQIRDVVQQSRGTRA